MTRLVVILTAAACTAAGWYATVIAQGPSAASQGIYTAEQAKRGATIYLEQCAGCHGENLEGAGAMPPLSGPGFLGNWTNKPVADLFDKTHSTMPATAPGTLTEQQAADVIAYMLQMSKYPAGTTELASSVAALKSVMLDAAPGGGDAAGAAPAAGGAGAAAGGGKTVAQGVYTEAQATRGASVYAEQCAGCHGEKLEGSGAMPPLAGADFAANWNGKTLADLFDKTHSTMPATAPGTLTEQQTADVLAYILKVAQYPAGTTEIAPSAEPLKEITITAP